MRRFIFYPDDRVGDTVLLSEAESKHLQTVLRLLPGDSIELMDGVGGVYTASILKVAKRVTAEILAVVEVAKEEAVPLWVCQGVLKSKKMDLVIQKCTELGVHRFVPIVSSRCQGRFNDPQARKKYERWHRISEESCKQCGRSRPMEIIQPVGVKDFLLKQEQESSGQKLLFWEEEKVRLLGDISSLEECKKVQILIGPEGGFTADEVELASGAGWKCVSLGSRILRAETANFASVAIIQHLLGNM